MTGPNAPERAASIFMIAGLMLGLLVGIAASPTKAAAQATAKAPTAISVTIPALPYPVSGLRQRLTAMGKSIPAVDESLQLDIPGTYYAPVKDMPTDQPDGHPAIVVLPDCDDHFPAHWITLFQEQGTGVLVISPNQAHPSQVYCSEGSLGNPKHGLTYWAFDALSALDYLAKQPGIDPERIAIVGYGYGGGAAQLAIYREGHAKHYNRRFRALVGLRPQCMSEMNNFVPSLLIGVKNDPFNPPSWCKWRMDRDLTPARASVRFEMLENGETFEKQATRTELPIETSPKVANIVTEFLSQNGISPQNSKN